MATTNRNKEFLAAIKPEAKAEIINSIAEHYGRTPEVILEEVTGADAYHLLEYMVEPQRSKASLLMQLHGMRGY
ncbi:hypothetical protein D3C85_1139340 [compost metagenome]